MKKSNAWTMPELIVAMIIMILISSLLAQVFKPDDKKARMFMYAIIKNLTTANAGVIQKYGSMEETNADPATTTDWYCVHVLDLFSTTGANNCTQKTASDNTGDTNFTLANGVEVKGLNNPWITPSGTNASGDAISAAYAIKNIVVDIDGLEVATIELGLINSR